MRRLSACALASLLLSAAASAAPSAPAGTLETRLRGPSLVLDWAAASPGPVRFRILTPEGRFIAERAARRSVQGWIASLRVQGWPAGVYRVETVAADVTSDHLLLLP